LQQRHNPALAKNIASGEEDEREGGAFGWPERVKTVFVNRLSEAAAYF